MWPVPVRRLLKSIDERAIGLPVVFDADGTLWRGDVGEDFLRYAIHQKLYGGSYRRYESLLKDSPARAYAYCVEVMAGQSEERLTAECAAFFAERYAGRIFRFVRPLLNRLRRANCSVWICSASPKWNVIPGALALGIPSEHVIAVDCDVTSGVLTGEVMQPVPVGPGKVHWLKRRQLVPVLAVGNGELDVDMLEYARHALVVSPPDTQNRLVAKAVESGWPILIGQ